MIIIPLFYPLNSFTSLILDGRFPLVKKLPSLVSDEFCLHAPLSALMLLNQRNSVVIFLGKLPFICKKRKSCWLVSLPGSFIDLQ